MRHESIAFIAAFVLVTGAIVQAEVIGPTVELNGNTFTVYSYSAFYDDGYGWEKINESFSDCGRDGYCTNSYDFKAQSKDGDIILTRDGESITYDMIDLFGTHPDFSQVKQADNWVLYTNVIPGVDIQHTFYADLLKEDIILVEKLKNPPPGDPQIVFLKSGKNNFEVDPFVMCDARGVCQKVDTLDEPDRLTLTISDAFLSDKDTVYPVTIDPSLRLNDTNTTFTGYIGLTNFLGTYSRTIDPANFVEVGRTVTALTFTDVTYRASFEFNISAIAPGSTITGLLLKTTVARVGTGGSEEISLHHIEQRNISYEDTSFGNPLYYEDMGNYTLYNTTNITDYGTGELIFNLSNVIPEFQSIIGVRDWFGFGFNTSFNTETSIPGVDINSTRIGSRRANTVNNRPYLNVTFIEPPPHVNATVVKVILQDTTRLQQMYFAQAGTTLFFLTASISAVFIFLKRRRNR